MRVSIAVAMAVVGVLAVAGCSGDDDDEGGGAPPTDGTEAVDTTDIVITDCTDGRQLVSNDQGWGYSDGAWTAQASGSSDPPPAELAACTG